MNVFSNDDIDQLDAMSTNPNIDDSCRRIWAMARIARDIGCIPIGAGITPDPEHYYLHEDVNYFVPRGILLFPRPAYRDVAK